MAKQTNLLSFFNSHITTRSTVLSNSSELSQTQNSTHSSVSDFESTGGYPEGYDPLRSRRHIPLTATPDCFPFFRLVSINQNGGSFFPAYDSTRRDKSAQDFFSLVRYTDFLFSQETHAPFSVRDQADTGDTYADQVRAKYPGYKAFHNPLSTSTAGTAIHVSPQILDRFGESNIRHYIHEPGYLHSLVITHTTGSTTRLVNYYGPNKNWGKHRRMVKLLGNLPKTDYLIIGGDFNFVENDEDTISDAKRSNAAATVKEWQNVTKDLHLSEVYQPHYTRIQPKRNDDGTLTIECARLDRWYTNFSEAIQSFARTNCFLQHSDYAISDNLLAIVDELPVKEIRSWRRTVPSDHLALALTISKKVPTRHKAKVPVWVANSDTFTQNFEALWNQKSKPDHPLKAAELLALTIHEASDTTREDLADRTPVAAQKIAILAKALLHLRTGSASTSEFTGLLKAHPFLDSLFTVTEEGIDTTALEEKLNLLYSEHGTSDESHGNDTAKKHSRHIKDSKHRVVLPSTRRQICSVRVTPDSAPLKSPPAVAEAFKDYWSRIFQEEEIDTSAIELILATYEKKISKEVGVISLKDVLYAIDNSPNTANGPDGISFAAIRAIRGIAAPIILDLIRYLQASGKKLPDGFNHASFHLLGKKGFTDQIDRTRPISVTNAINRIIASVLCRKLRPAIEDILSDKQLGFISGGSTGGNISFFNQLQVRDKDQRQQGYLLFLDFEKAFDSISHKYLLKILKFIGIPSWACNMIDNLMTDVRAIVATPYLSEFGFPVHRGVKQGCPLSPLLFALAIDPLLSQLDSNPDLHPRAFADDIGIYSTRLESILEVKASCDRFTRGTGLRLSHDKSMLLPNQPLTRADRDTIADSNWSVLKTTDRALYLGALFGSGHSGDFDTYSIYECVVRKVLRRIKLLNPLTRSLSVGKRILVANTYIIPILGYLFNFFLIPPGHRKTVEKAFAKFIMPVNSASYRLLCGHPKLMSFKPKLRNLFLDNISRLSSAHNDFDNFTVDTPLKHEEDIDKGHSFENWLEWDTDISFHRDYACNYVRVYPSVHLEGNPGISAIYSAITNSEYEYQQYRTELLRKLLRYNLDSKLDTINKNFKLLDSKLSHIGNHFLSIVTNSLQTARRLGRFHRTDAAINPHLSSDAACFLCDNHQDSIEHLFGLTHTYVPKGGKDRNKCKGNCNHLLVTTANSPWPQRCQITSTPACATVWDFIELVNRRERTNIAYDRKDLLLVDPDVDKKTVRIIGNILYSIWQARRYKELSSSHSSIGLLLAVYSTLCTGTKNNLDRIIGKKERKLAKAKRYIRMTKQLLGSLPDDALIIFTDGSAFGNPGPAGAGMVVFFRGKVIKTTALGIGRDTNNTGELVGLGLALQFINHYKGRFSSSVIFTDSEYAKKITLGVMSSSTNQQLISSLRAAFALNQEQNRTRIYWVPGHAGLDGNEKADAAAKEGARNSFIGNFTPPGTLDFVREEGHIRVILDTNTRNIPNPEAFCQCANCRLPRRAPTANLRTPTNPRSRATRAPPRAFSRPVRRSRRLARHQEPVPTPTDAPT